jgi:Zinc-binding dehydrogenase
MPTEGYAADSRPPQLEVRHELRAPTGLRSGIEHVGHRCGAFLNEGDASADLATLVRLVDDGSLSVEIGWRGPLEQIAEAVEALRARRVTGKAVLDLAHSVGWISPTSPRARVSRDIVYMDTEIAGGLDVASAVHPAS